MLYKKKILSLYGRIHEAKTHSWGIPCLRKGGLLNLRRRNGDGSG